TEQLTEEYAELLLDSKPKQAMELLKNEVIPQHKDLLDNLSHVALTEHNLVEFNKLSQELTQIKLDQLLYSKNIFEDILLPHQKKKLTDLNNDQATEGMHILNEQ